MLFSLDLSLDIFFFTAVNYVTFFHQNIHLMYPSCLSFLVVNLELFRLLKISFLRVIYLPFSFSGIDIDGVSFTRSNLLLYFK